MPPKKQKKQYGPDGKYYRKRITRPDGKKEDIYAKTLTELADKVTVRRCELTDAQNAPPEHLYTFEYCAAFYRRAAPHLSHERRQVYQYQINKVICPVIGGKQIKDVTLDDLKDVLVTRAHLSRRSQQDTVQILKQIFSAAEDSGVIQRDPSRKLRPGGRPPAQKHALTEDQQEKLLEAVRGLKVEPMIMLGLYTGMRRGEICGLRWEHVRLDEKTPRIEVRSACRWPDKIHPEVEDRLKTPAAYRDIPIPPALKICLEQLREDQLARLPEERKGEIGDLFVYGNDDGSAISYSTFRRRWDTIRTRSTASGRKLGEKIRNHDLTVTLDFMPTPHILRHTYVTRLVLSKMDLKRVQYLAGHSDPEITLKIYTSLQKAQPDDLAADVWAAFDAADGDDE